MTNIIKGAFSWISAVLIGGMIVNLVLFAYNRPVGWIDRYNASTYGIWHPGKVLVHATEGFGVYRIDNNGYVNEGNLIEEGYVLVVGASFTQGKEVRLGNRYTDILNGRCREAGIIGKDELVAYNLSQDGYYLPAIINGFNCILSEFPNSSAIVIEIGSTLFQVSELEACIDQRKYNPSECGETITNRLTRLQRAVFAIKEYFPIINQIKSQIETITGEQSKVKEKISDFEAYANSLDDALALIRSEYKGKLYIVYHPSVILSRDGMTINDNETDAIFERICRKNGIVFLDMSGEFSDMYDSEYGVPYGYWNTTMGTGHLSKAGHKAIANVLQEEVMDSITQ